jgi:hypothetical protein
MLYFNGQIMRGGFAFSSPIKNKIIKKRRKKEEIMDHGISLSFIFFMLHGELFSLAKQ